MSASGRTRLPITVAILAGGAARRFGGQDKGLILLRGRPMVEWVLEAVSAHPVERILIVANRNNERYARHAEVIGDRRADHPGPLAGVSAALEACASRWLYTVPVDCPTPPAGLFERLWSAAATSGREAVVAHDGERRQPLFAVYRRELAASAAQSLAAGAGVARWQDGLQIHEVEVCGANVEWINLNSPEDVDRFDEREGAGE